MMTPYSINSFQQIIGQSGSVISPAWHEYTAEDAKRWGKRIVDVLGCNITENIDDQIECLQMIDPLSILNCEIQVGHMGPQAVLDTTFSDYPFLPNHPRQLIMDGNYNKDASVLLGSNRDDGLLSTYSLIRDPTQFELWRDNWKETLGPYLLFAVEPEFVDEKILAAVDKLTSFYIGDVENMNIHHIHGMTQMLTDALFAYGVHDFVGRHLTNAKDDSIFQYIYTHEGEHSLLMDMTDNITSPYGVCHADELYMLFDPLFVDWIPEEGLNDADARVSDTMVELWKQFIKTGNPSTEDIIWSPIRYDGRKYLRLTYSESSFMEYPKEWQKRMEVWDEVMAELAMDVSVVLELIN